MSRVLRLSGFDPESEQSVPTLTSSSGGSSGCGSARRERSDGRRSRTVADVCHCSCMPSWVAPPCISFIFFFSSFSLSASLFSFQSIHHPTLYTHTHAQNQACQTSTFSSSCSLCFIRLSCKHTHTCKVAHLRPPLFSPSPCLLSPPSRLSIPAMSPRDKKREEPRMRGVDTLLFLRSLRFHLPSTPLTRRLVHRSQQPRATSTCTHLNSRIELLLPFYSLHSLSLQMIAVEPQQQQQQEVSLALHCYVCLFYIYFVSPLLFSSSVQPFAELAPNCRVSQNQTCTTGRPKSPL